MSADELWVEVYQGEVLGEALFGLLTEREQDPARRRQLETLVVLERSTKELAAPVLARRALEPGDTAMTVASAAAMADAVSAMPWERFVASLEPGTHATIVRLAEHDGELLHWFYDQGLVPGQEIVLRSTEPAADQFTVTINGGERAVSEKAAAGLFVKPA